jgi:hypothetical protein
VSLARSATGAEAATLARARAGEEGAFRLEARPTAAGELVLTAPRFGALSPLRVPVARVAGP